MGCRTRGWPSIAASVSSGTHSSQSESVSPGRGFGACHPSEAHHSHARNALAVVVGVGGAVRSSRVMRRSSLRMAGFLQCGDALLKLLSLERLPSRFENAAQGCGLTRQQLAIGNSLDDGGLCIGDAGQGRDIR